MMEHTKEPWDMCSTPSDNREEYPDGSKPGVSAGYTAIAWMAETWVNADTQIANSSRIVACVNACKNIPSEKIEEMLENGLDFGIMLGSAKRILEQRDKLLASAKTVNEYCCERYTDEGDRGGVRMPKMYQPDCIQSSMDLIAEIEATK